MLGLVGLLLRYLCCFRYCFKPRNAHQVKYIVLMVTLCLSPVSEFKCCEVYFYKNQIEMFSPIVTVLFITVVETFQSAFFFSVLAKRLAGKSVCEITHFC